MGRRGQPFLSGMFTRGEVSYAWPGAEGKVGGAGSDREPVAIFTARRFRSYRGEPRRRDYFAPCSNDLASEMGRGSAKEDLHLTYKDRAWVLRLGAVPGPESIVPPTAFQRLPFPKPAFTRDLRRVGLAPHNRQTVRQES